ncbi:hypothetical protein GEMRC1_008462 [Eukaryota sp. GEM-RC1]
MSRSKDRRDVYYRLAKEQNYRARSAFKLIQIDETYSILNNVTRAVDLCAAPGSFSQVLASRIPSSLDRRIVSVDLNEMAPIDGVTLLQGDITSRSTALKTIELLNGQADLVVSDGAPDVSGLEILDQYLQSTLVSSALDIATAVLRHGGNFVAKIFRAFVCPITLLSHLMQLFENVHIVKPRSSRNSSLEAFVVCLNYRPPADYVSPLLRDEESISRFSEETKKLLPLLSCGDLSSYDSDMSYQLNSNDVLPAVQPPINCPYSDVIAK